MDKRAADFLPADAGIVMNGSPVKRLKLNREHFQKWKCEDVCDYMRDNGLEDLVGKFRDNKITGNMLHLLSDERLEKMGIDLMGDKLRVVMMLDDLKTHISVSPGFPRYLYENECKVFNDPIHGHIELHPLCVKILDTPQFQRLRNLKQLGGCYYVFPGASHNRFEHSIGVCYLAGQLVREIRNRQPELDITDEDILCVEIAGLCHDLGHGPFSHLFDARFIPMVNPNSDWQHEHASVNMFDYLVQDNGLEDMFKRFRLDNTDRLFIKEQIAGPSGNKSYQGRKPNKSFLYEVVANKRNGIDVDKWDYFARDCHHLGITSNFDHRRFIKFARVLDVDGQLQICNRDKEVVDVYDMFHTRTMLHRTAYQHKTQNITETMIVEALVKADPYILRPGCDGKLVKMSDAIHDMVAYSQLTDDVFYEILYSRQEELKPARSILQQIQRRQLYKCIGQTKPIDHVLNKKDTGKMEREIASSLTEAELKKTPLPASNYIVSLVTFDYGMKEKNPIDHVRFYQKSNPTVAIQVRKDEVSQMLPETFRDQHVRVYCTQLDSASLNIATRCFKQWCANKNMMSPKCGDVFSVEMTPLKRYAAQPDMKSLQTKLEFNDE